MLLSKGRVIYHGPVEGAAPFFVTSIFHYSMESYENPADFLLDISGCQIADATVSVDLSL